MPLKKQVKQPPKKEAKKQEGAKSKAPEKKSNQTKTEKGKIHTCSFCKKNTSETRKMIAGPDDIFICEECIEVCFKILSAEGEYSCPLITFKTGRVMQEIGSQLSIAPNQRTRLKYDVLYLSPKNTISDKIYKSIVMPIAEKQKVKIKHFTEILNTKNSFDKELLDIYSSMMIIADVQGQDPNIMHLLGMIHLIDKPLIILTQKPEDVPSSLNKNRQIIYGNSEKSLSELQPVIQSIFLAIKKIKKIAKGTARRKV